MTTTQRPCGLAFAPAPPVPGLASPPPRTRRLILQKARRHPGSPPGSDRPEAHGFRICFTPLAGVLFTVPSRYWFTIGRWRCLALGRGRPRFTPDSACPELLTIRWPRPDAPSPTGLSPPVAVRSSDLRLEHRCPGEPAAAGSPSLVQPRPGIAGRLCHQNGLGSSPFARRY